MSLDIVRQVDRQYPALLLQNVNYTNYQFVVKVIAALRAQGHAAYHVCKTAGEGQYTPVNFNPRTVVGRDGKAYFCTGVSHDAIWCDGAQFDLIAGGNDASQPIYRRNGEPNWSFDPNDGPQITGVPVWNAIPEMYWRVNNPPLIEGLPIPEPPVPAVKILPKADAFEFLKALDAFYAAPEGLQRPDGIGGDMEAIAQWFYQGVIEGHSIEDVKAQIRHSDEWKVKHR